MQAVPRRIASVAGGMRAKEPSPPLARFTGMAFLLRKTIDPAEARLVLSPAEAAVRAALGKPRRERRP
mgnify:CR=1 FL=1